MKSMKMKTLLWSAGFAFLMTGTSSMQLNAAGRTIPNCWEGNVAQGSYLVSLNTEEATKEELLILLSELRHGPAAAESFPLIMSDFMMISVKAVPSLLYTDVRRATEEHLESIASRIPGLKVECDALTYPTPGISIGN